MRRILLIRMTNIQTRKHTYINPNTDDGARSQSSSDNDEQTLLSKNGSHWRRSVPSQVTAARLQQHNIVRIRAGPTSYSTSRIIRGSPLSSFHILFNKPMLRNIQKCTIAEAHRAPGNNNWTVALNELDKFVGLIVARGVIGGKTLPIKSMWDKSWGCLWFNATMPCWRFLEIMKYPEVGSTVYKSTAVLYLGTFLVPIPVPSVLGTSVRYFFYKVPRYSV